MVTCWRKFGMFGFISFLVVFFLLIVFRNQNQNLSLISVVVENILHGIHLTGTMQSAVMVKSTMKDDVLDHLSTKNEKDDRWVLEKIKRNKNQHFGHKWQWVKDFYEIRRNCNYRTVTRIRYRLFGKVTSHEYLKSKLVTLTKLEKQEHQSRHYNIHPKLATIEDEEPCHNSSHCYSDIDYHL